MNEGRKELERDYFSKREEEGIKGGGRTKREESVQSKGEDWGANAV